MEFEQLDESFIRTMNEIGRHGWRKHGANSFQGRRLAGVEMRGPTPNDRLAGGYSVLRLDGVWIGRIDDRATADKLIVYITELESQRAKPPIGAWE